MLLGITDDLIARQPPEVQAVMRALLAHIAQQDQRIADLQARIAELEAELKGLRKTPQNSSLPPSSQHPHAKPPRPKKDTTTKRKRGGQPGHPKHERALIPVEQCTEVIPLKPEDCRRCGTKLDGVDASPLRHQVWELPEIKPLVTEYQRHRLTCPGCGESTCAQLPADVSTGTAGPRLIAFSALLMAYYRQSKRRTSLFLETTFGIPCCPSSVVKHQNISTAALRSNYEEAVAALPSQSCLNGDESPTKQANQKAWLWTFVAGTFTVFAIRGSRAATTIHELLGTAFAGVLSCDRAKMYWRCGRLQWCWSHLKRDFQRLIEHCDPQVKRLGHDLMRPTKEMFRAWSLCRDGTMARSKFQRLMAPIRQQVNALLLRGHGTAVDGMCRELYDHRDWLWTFVDVAGIEPTNNSAERALRHAVIWRKLSFGTQSESGSRFVETLLSVIETCRQQKRSVFDHVTQAVRAHLAHQPAPSLLPRA